MKKCVFSGVFDPPTAGHEHVIKTCLSIFDEVVVAIMINTDKTPFLTAEERKILLDKLFGGESRVRVIIFNGAAVDLLEMENTPYYVRGVRNTTDFEYENRNAFANRRLKKDIITIYIPAVQEELHISSTLVRNSVKFGKDYSDCVPEKILADFKKMAEAKNV